MKQAVDPKVDGFLRFRINLSYDGTEFAGWAKQPGLRTVQGELTKALTQIFGKTKDDFGMRVAGRTDAGVHAEGQVVHIDLTPKQLKRLGRSKDVLINLNALLPVDIRVSKFVETHADFDARFAAKYRKYRYRIADSVSGWNPLYGRTTLWIKYPLDIEAMQDAAEVLIGLHDFAAFSKPKERATTIRTLQHIKITRNKHFDNVVEIELQADAFAHNMVRSIVGALLKVGAGRVSKADVAKALKSKSRGHGFKVVGPEGLSLIEVGYPSQSQWADQVKMTQDLRTLAE